MKGIQEYRGFKCRSFKSRTRDLWRTEGFKEHGPIMYGVGETEEEAMNDLKKMIDNFFDY